MCDLNESSASTNLNDFKTIDSDDSDTTIIVDCNEENFKVTDIHQPSTSNHYNLYSVQQENIELQSILSKYSNFVTSGRPTNPVTEKCKTEINSVIELSSDEDNEVDGIKSNNKFSNEELYENSSDEDAVFLGTNLNINTQVKNKLEDNDNKALSRNSSDEDAPFPCFNLNKQAKNCGDSDNKALSGNSSDEDAAFPLTNLNINKRAKINNSQATNSPKKKRKINPDKEAKQRAQQTKKQEAEKEKLLKQALAAVNKNLKPEECLKLVTVLIDNEIASEKYGGEILNALQAAEIAYRLHPQILPHTITWNLQVQKADVNMPQPVIKTEIIETKEILLILNWNETVELVHNKSLITHIESFQSIFVNRKVFLAIYGLENYFKYQKSKKQKEVKAQITQEVQKNKKQDKVYENIPKIDRKQLERSLTELQLLCNCCYRFIESPQDLGSMVVQFSKSIAQASYKLEKSLKQQQAEWYIDGDNKDCVRVDKNGNGLKRLWQQQITSFPLARLELAEAVISKFDTPSALFKEYDRCSQDDKEKLLQEIPIRRAAGPLSSVRKIGPEFSKKVCKFFTSLDGNAVL